MNEFQSGMLWYGMVYGGYSNKPNPVRQLNNFAERFHSRFLSLRGLLLYSVFSFQISVFKAIDFRC